MPVTRRESARARRLREAAQALGQLLIATAEDSFEVLEPKFKALEKQLLAVTRSNGERREIQRRIAETLLTQAFATNSPWPVFGRALRRITRLGYSRVERRYHVAALYALWCHGHPEHDNREARRLLDEAQHSILRLPRRDAFRKQLLRELAELRARTGFHVAPRIRQ